jgi:hypothetical protein
MVHAGVRQLLAERFGFHGFFTFHRTGWAAYLDYLMVESSKNQLTIWTARWCSTPRAIPEKRLKLNFNRCPLKLQADGRMTKSKGARPAGKRRKHMTFSELTDFVLERKVSTVAELWQAGG